MCEFSGLIRSGQKNKVDALAEISIPKPIDKSIEDEIRTRCGFSEQEWEAIWNSPKKHYTDYPTYKRTFEILRPLFFILYKKDMLTEVFMISFV